MAALLQEWQLAEAPVDLEKILRKHLLAFHEHTFEGDWAEKSTWEFAGCNFEFQSEQAIANLISAALLQRQ